MLGRLLPRPDGLLLRSLRGTEWSQLTDYVSRSFFEVLPARAVWSQLRELGGNASDGRRFAEAQRAVEATLSDLDGTIRVGHEAPDGLPGPDAQDEATRRARGQRVLEIYFGQITRGTTALLDLRPSRFAGADGPLYWTPRPLYLTWDPAFLASLRDLYGGFYQGDDARFRAGLAALEIDAAEDVFRTHFGAGDQRAVRFDAKAFHATFHEVFVRCRDAGVRLHPNFLALGIYLGCLYDHLEALGLAFDVREAYQRSAPPEETR